MQLFVQLFFKIFFILTPFFVMSVFLVMSKDCDSKERKKLGFKVGLAVMVLNLSMFYLGKYIFMLFGITIDAFRVGAGILLFLSAISIVKGEISETKTSSTDMAIVPLAIPVTVGPGTIGMLLVLSGEMNTINDKIIATAAMVLTSLFLGFLLSVSVQIEKIIGEKGISILSKITGLFVASVASQLVISGVKNLLK
ncbi:MULTISPECIES: MarC family protein [Calditerrivibrio]|uniref:MarC family protein n=1 Tax=Calditerrivibrio TaxID=545865 RepID=UPI003C710CEB